MSAGHICELLGCYPQGAPGVAPWAPRHGPAPDAVDAGEISPSIELPPSTFFQQECVTEVDSIIPQVQLGLDMSPKGQPPLAPVLRPMPIPEAIVDAELDISPLTSPGGGFTTLGPATCSPAEVSHADCFDTSALDYPVVMASFRGAYSRRSSTTYGVSPEDCSSILGDH